MQRRAWLRSSLGSLRNLGRDEHGGPMVEFTIIMPMFFIMMFGIIEWGNMFYVENNMLIAARQAVRSVAVGVTTDDGGATAVKVACGTSPYAATPITGTSYTYNFTVNTDVTCTAAEAAAAAAGTPYWGNVTMTVTTSAATASVINYLGKIGGTLSATATMQEEFVCPGAAQTTYTKSTTC